MRRAWLSLSILLIYANVANAFVNLGAGTASCGTWTQYRRGGVDNQAYMSSWLFGFVTAHGYNHPELGDLSASTDNRGMAAWVDNYCAQNPLDQVVEAAIALVKELEKRKR